MQKIGNQIKTYPTGCAHYLEHQMFRLHGKDITGDFAQMQAQTNAFTAHNKTAYYFQTTADIEKPLELLLDFVEELDIDKDSVQKEKGIILSEHDMYQQQPEQRLLKETWYSLFHKHPLRNDVLGTREDISNMTVEQLSAFYRYNYDPSRLILVGITGKDLSDTMQIIEKNQLKHPSAIKQEVFRYIQTEDLSVCRKCFNCHMDISTPYVCIAYKLANAADVQEGLFQDLAIQLRLDSFMSSLNPDYQKWMDERIITNVVGAECDITTDHAYILFYAQTNKVNEYVELVHEITKEMVQPMNEKIFQSLKIRTISQNIRNLDHFDNLAIDLIEAKVDGYSYWDCLEYIDQMSTDAIHSVTQRIDFSNSTVTTIYPKHSK